MGQPERTGVVCRRARLSLRNSALENAIPQDFPLVFDLSALLEPLACVTLPRYRACWLKVAALGSILQHLG